ncbi:MAG: pyridoxamine 5'-phosphate oxidase family protein [Bacteroidetes bacterium]|nr:pyridoxamine 5'-phosphate oxidase family protein [Bacteroidota bacterium]
MILSNREIKNPKEINEIFNETLVCNVGTVDGEWPYVLPFNFAWEEPYIYLHSAMKGKLHDVLALNNRVCLTFSTANEVFYRNKEVACSWGMKYKSIVAFGRVEYIEAFEEKVRILNLVMKKYSGSDQFNYNSPAINNVCAMRIKIERLTGKKYGHP